MAAQDAAQAQVALKYDPQQAAIERQIAAIQGQTQANEAGLNQYGQTGRQTIGSVYDTLNSLLTGNRAQSKTDLSNQAALVGQGYDQANAYQNQVANEGRSRLSGMAGALGAGTAGNLQVQTGLESALANILGQNGQARAAATGNLNTWAGQWDQILGNGINIGEQTRAKTAGDFETELLGLLGQNKVAGLEGQNDQYGRLSDVLSARQNDLISTYNQLAQQEWENAFRQAQMDQEAQKANASLSLQAQGMADDRAYKNAALAKDGQMSDKDLINLWMQQAGMQADRDQQGTENMFKRQGLDLDRAQFEADRGNPAQDLFSSMLFGENGDIYRDPKTGSDALAQLISDMSLAGYDTSFLNLPTAGALGPGNGGAPALFNDKPVYGNPKNANPANQPWAPSKWGSKFVEGMSRMFPG